MRRAANGRIVFSDAMSAAVRRARTSDVRQIQRLVQGYVDQGILLGKQLVTLFEDVPDFVVAELDGKVVGCGAVHVMWEDLAEIRTVAVEPELRGHGIGDLVVSRLLEHARELGVRRVFVLTFEVRFFGRHGFHEIDGTPVQPEVYDELRRSYDEGVAEFLDLPRVKPDTLGNSRMLLEL
jgi:amino-acid N-acetyltransferase